MGAWEPVIQETTCIKRMKTTRKTNSAQRLMVAFSAAIALSGAAGATAGTYSDTVLADNPIAYYRFEELPGATVVLDSSVSGAYAGTYFFDDSGNRAMLLTTVPPTGSIGSCGRRLSARPTGVR
jgi:hypothetical protein